MYNRVGFDIIAVSAAKYLRPRQTSMLKLLCKNNSCYPLITFAKTPALMSDSVLDMLLLQNFPVPSDTA